MIVTEGPLLPKEFGKNSEELQPVLDSNLTRKGEGDTEKQNDEYQLYRASPIGS